MFNFVEWCRINVSKSKKSHIGWTKIVYFHRFQFSHVPISMTFDFAPLNKSLFLLYHFEMLSMQHCSFLRASSMLSLAVYISTSCANKFSKHPSVVKLHNSQTVKVRMVLSLIFVVHLIQYILSQQKHCKCTTWARLCKYEPNQRYSVPRIPYDSNFLRRYPWFIPSNHLLLSNRHAPICLFSCILYDQSSNTLWKLVVLMTFRSKCIAFKQNMFSMHCIILLSFGCSQFV